MEDLFRRTSPGEPRIPMTIEMLWMYGRFGGSCSFLSTWIFSAGSVVILKCCRGAMEVATINKQVPVLPIVSNLFLVYISPFTSAFSPLFYFLALIEEHISSTPSKLLYHSLHQDASTRKRAKAACTYQDYGQHRSRGLFEPLRPLCST